MTLNTINVTTYTYEIITLNDRIDMFTDLHLTNYKLKILSMQYLLQPRLLQYCARESFSSNCTIKFAITNLLWCASIVSGLSMNFHTSHSSTCYYYAIELVSLKARPSETNPQTRKYIEFKLWYLLFSVALVKNRMHPLERWQAIKFGGERCKTKLEYKSLRLYWI